MKPWSINDFIVFFSRKEASPLPAREVEKKEKRGMTPTIGRSRSTEYKRRLTGVLVMRGREANGHQKRKEGRAAIKGKSCVVFVLFVFDFDLPFATETPLIRRDTYETVVTLDLSSCPIQ